MSLVTVATLLTKVEGQFRFPEMFKLSRNLTEPAVPATNRPVDTMEWVAGVARSAWTTYSPSPVSDAGDDVLAEYAAKLQNDPRDQYPGEEDQFNVLRNLIVCDRNYAFVVQVQQAYVDATRTHQETFFCTQRHQEIHDSLDRAIRDTSEYLWGS